MTPDVIGWNTPGESVYHNSSGEESFCFGAHSSSSPRMMTLISQTLGIKFFATSFCSSSSFWCPGPLNLHIGAAYYEDPASQSLSGLLQHLPGACNCAWHDAKHQPEHWQGEARTEEAVCHDIRVPKQDQTSASNAHMNPPRSNQSNQQQTACKGTETCLTSSGSTGTCQTHTHHTHLGCMLHTSTFLLATS